MKKNYFSSGSQDAYFAYRRIIGLESPRRSKRTVYLEQEFIEMFAPGKLSDVINMAMNDYAVKAGLVIAGDEEEDNDT